MLLPERVCGFFFLHKKDLLYEKISFLFFFSIHLFGRWDEKSCFDKKNIKWGRREREGVRRKKREATAVLPERLKKP
mgnify:CR=1 FL=1